MNLPTFTVLIVEDLPENRELYRECLLTDSSCAYDLIEAGSVAEGLELYSTNTIDAILLDYLLPDGDGLKFLEIISQRSPGRSLPVVMMTGHGSESVAVRAMKLGAQDYLVKGSFTPQLLISAMQSAIENARLRLQLQYSQEQLQASSEQIITIWESMTDAYLSLDGDWRIVYTNPAAIQVIERLVGLAPEEFIGKTHWEVFPWSADNFVEQKYRQAVTDRVAVHFEVFYEPTSTWFEIHAYPSEIGLGIYFRDINDRKQKEAERIQFKQQRDRFFDLSLDLLAISNFEGYMLSLNPAWEKVLGFTAAELMAQPYLDLVHPDDLAATLAATQALSQGETAIKFENRYRCKDGSYRWLSWNSRPYDDQNLVYAVAYDITEAKQTASILQAYQATVQQQLGEIEAIYKMAPIGLCFIDTDLRFVRINEQLAEINGLSVAAHLGHTLREVGLEMADQLEPLHQQVIDSGEPILNLELSGMTAAQPGVLRHWLVCYHPQKDPADRMVGVNVMVQETTLRKHQEAKHQQAEAALFQRESQLQLFVKHVPVSVAMFDRHMNYLSASDRWIASYRLPDRDIIGRSHYDISPDRSQRWESIYQGCLAGAVASCEEDPFILTDGSIVWIRWEIYPWYANIDEIGGIMIFSEVITDRKQTQTDLEQRNQELDSFTHVVSHDLKAPLRAIANLSEWIEEDLEGALSVANQEQMVLLRSRVYKMQATIDGLLDYARLGQLDETIESVAVAELLAEVIDSLGYPLGTRIDPPPTFTIELPPDLPTLSTRRLPLFQVFANLIGNGIKHHDRPDGSIVISLEDRGDCYEFAIADDGPGIAPEQHERVFRIFQAVNPQNRADSTGIGLAIVKKIVQAQGGTIWLESQLGKGTTFCFTWLK